MKLTDLVILIQFAYDQGFDHEDVVMAADRIDQEIGAMEGDTLTLDLEGKENDLAE